MRKIIVMVMMFVVLTAGFAVASDPVNVDIGIDNKNTVTANGGNAASNQNQNQQQEQNQKQSASGNATLVNETPRELITAQPGPSGNFVANITSMAGDCIPLFGQGLYKTFTTKQIQKMADSGSAMEGKGGWFHSLFTSNINAVTYEAFEGKPDDRPVTLIDWEPIGNKVYPGDRIIGEVSCTGDYGWPLGSSLGKCLAKAKEITNTTRVFACVSVRNDSRTSGLSIGSGGAASKMMGPAASGSLALAGLIGTTTSFADTAFDVKIIALNDGDAEWQRKQIYVAPPPVIEKPCPQVACNPNDILFKISELKREVQKCTRYCYNNLTLRNALGDAYVDLYVCTDDKKYLQEAMYHYQVAERNFRNGHDISAHRAEAGQVIAQVYYNWAGCKNILEGREQAMRFAKAKRLERIPLGFTR